MALIYLDSRALLTGGFRQTNNEREILTRLRGPAVEHWSLADVLSLSCARLVAYVGKPSAIGQPTFILSGSINE